MFVIVNSMGSRWWTSATDSGCPGKMAWCGSGVPFSKTEHTLDEAGVESAERCVVLRRVGGLRAAPCDEFNRPLCEVNLFQILKINIQLNNFIRG
jgi:hypothetical protein